MAKSKLDGKTFVTRAQFGFDEATEDYGDIDGEDLFDGLALRLYVGANPDEVSIDDKENRSFKREVQNLEVHDEARYERVSGGFIEVERVS